MATTKKSTVKKAPAKAPAKKTVATKAVSPKKKATKAKVSKKTKSPSMRSFRVSRSDQPFTSFRITRQTVYWLILIAFIMFAQLWILKLQIEVATLLELQQQELSNSI